MDAIRDAREVSQRRPRGELNPRGGGEGGGPPLHMKFSRDAAIPRIPAPHLLKQGQLQLAGASFRDYRNLSFSKTPTTRRKFNPNPLVKRKESWEQELQQELVGAKGKRITTAQMSFPARVFG